MTMQLMCKASAEPSSLELCRAAASNRAVIINHSAKIQHQYCGFRMLGRFFSVFFQGTKHVVILVIWSFGQNRFLVVKIRTININIYIYLIVSKNRVSEIDFDHFDLDHLTTRADCTS